MKLANIFNLILNLALCYIAWRFLFELIRSTI